MNFLVEVLKAFLLQFSLQFSSHKFCFGNGPLPKITFWYDAWSHGCNAYLVDVTDPADDLLDAAGRSTVVEPLSVKALSALPESSNRTCK